MNAVRLLAWSDIRRRWRGALVLTLLVGLVGGVVLASLAGARRTATSLSRFERSTGAADVEITAGETTAAQIRAFRRTPNIAGMGVLRQLALYNEDAGFLPVAGPTDRSFGREVDRARLVAGRRAHATDELTIGEGLRNRLGLGLGDRIQFESFAPEQLPELDERDLHPAGPRVTFRIVGIVRRPLDLGGRGAAGGVIVPTRAFMDAYGDRIGSFGGTILRVRTAHGATDVPEVVAAARRMFGDQESFSALGLAVEGAGAQSAIDVTSVALWILSGVAALAGLVAIALILARHVAAVGAERDALRAIGLRRGQLWGTSFASVVPVAIGGSLIAVAGAMLASPTFPIGVARDAEPSPGFDVDWLVLAGGFLVSAALVSVVAGLVAFVATSRADAVVSRPALPTETASRAGLPAVMVTGVGFALERGRGRGVVPVRSSLVGAACGFLAVVAALVFAASLDRLLTTPRYYGWTWDLVAVDTRAAKDDPCGPTDAFARDHVIASVTTLCLGNVEMDGHPVPGYGFATRRGHIVPAVLEGRAPRTAREVTLGGETLDALGKEVGDSVRGTSASHHVTFRVVGRSVFPPIANADPLPLADGAAFTGEGLERAGGTADSYQIVRWAPGVDHARGLAHLERVGAGFEPVGPVTPAEVERLQQIDALPGVLAAFVALVALVAVGHALVTTVRRRRHDLAVLKTLGYRRAQVRATVAWHATTVVIIGAAVGIPLGLVVGRLVWALVADDLGVVTTAVVPVVALVVVAVSGLLAANVVAAFPARSAARTQPAVVLRSE